MTIKNHHEAAKDSDKPDHLEGPEELYMVKMTEGDIPEVTAIEKACFSTPWSGDSFKSEITENEKAIYLCVKKKEKLLGYAGIWKVADEGHIMNIAVLPGFQHMGIGSLLLENMIRTAVDSEIKSMTLEVRESNVAALKLYEKFGFYRAAIRKKYYEHPVEDAVIMWLDL